jgi:hypothetical protein
VQSGKRSCFAGCAKITLEQSDEIQNRSDLVGSLSRFSYPQSHRGELADVGAEGNPANLCF